MNSLEDKLQSMRTGTSDRKIRIMIVGLGSVGNYLLDYLMSSKDDRFEIIVVGRNHEKMESDVNIVRVASLIRGLNRTGVKVVSGVDLNDVKSIARCLDECKPDIIVNSSRAYSGLKYGSISWNNIRAYGIWAPLSIKYVKNIMAAYEKVECNAVVINTSYSDAIIPWLKSAGKAYPDFGSGNINHLIPRIKFAISGKLGIEDYWNIDITYATSHFHDVVISKEGQVEGVDQLIVSKYGGKVLNLDYNEIFSKCKIPMPSDAKRNMMNASSNYEIIRGIIDAVKDNAAVKLHSPGVFGEIGGYPVIIDGTSDRIVIHIDESEFTLEEMRKKNRESIYHDGIQDVSGGVLIYTDELVKKVSDVFGVKIKKKVPFDEIEETADILVKEIIERNGAN